MGPRLERLLSVAGPSLGPAVSGVAGVVSDLSDLLTRSNGFFAFESALHVLPSGPAPIGTMSVQLWNDADLWRGSYGGAAEDLLFFAEDIFGGQFALSAAGVVSFDPETGDVEQLANDLEGWADRILADYELLTGFPLAHAWQLSHGQLPVTKRLLPKRPFVLGGEFVVENLYALDAVEGMRLRAELATQLRNLPDGASVTFKIVE